MRRLRTPWRKVQGDDKPTRMTESETWDLRSTLPPLLADAVGRIRDRALGYPYDMDEHRWDHILSEIVNDFERVADQNDHVPARALDLMKEHWLDLWD